MEQSRESAIHAEVDAGDDDAWPDPELVEVHQLNELGAGVGAASDDDDGDE